MKTEIRAIHFAIKQPLQEFIEKKIEKLSRRYPDVEEVEVVLKVEKPESHENKDVAVTVKVPGVSTAYANKLADTFEEAFDNCLASIEPSLERLKERK